MSLSRKRVEMNPAKSTVPSSDNICVFGAQELAVSVSAVIAYKCPKMNIRIVDFDYNQVVLWGEKKVKGIEPELEDLLEKCQNINLSFVTDIEGVILTSDIILLMMDDSKLSSSKSPDLQRVEEAARLIAKISESSKIIVQKTFNIPVGACENLKTILMSNESKKINFQVLAMPEFFSSASPVLQLLNPKFVLIGHDKNIKGKKAAEVLINLYTNWVPIEKIKTMSCASAELTKLCINALIAQRLVAVGAFAAICEHSKKNINEITKILAKTKLGDQYLEPEFSLGDVNLLKDVTKLIFLCHENKLGETRNYWAELINQNAYQQLRFKRTILFAFFNTLTKKKFAIFGVSFKGNGEITSDLPAISLGAKILEEGAMLSFYEPSVKLNSERMYEALRECGAKKVETQVKFFEDPYRAAEKVDGIIFCTNSDQFKSLNFASLYKEMRKPSHIFDGQNVLNHEYLIQMGFKVKTIGKVY